MKIFFGIEIIAAGILVLIFGGSIILYFWRSLMPFFIGVGSVALIYGIIIVASDELNPPNPPKSDTSHDETSRYIERMRNGQIPSKSPHYTSNSLSTAKSVFNFRTTMGYIDTLDGREFELYIGELLKKLEYQNVEVTQQSGDQGVDVIAWWNNKKIAFQCKHYEGSVGNHAVQELYAGKNFYDCESAVLVTNSHFTESTQKLAAKLNIELWNREKLRSMISADTSVKN